MELTTSKSDFFNDLSLNLHGRPGSFWSDTSRVCIRFLRLIHHIRIVDEPKHPSHLLANLQKTQALTHWGRVTHVYASKRTIIGSDDGLLPDRHQAILWTNAGILLIGPLGTKNFYETLISIPTFSFNKTHLKMSSGKWRPSCLGLNVLTH